MRRCYYCDVEPAAYGARVGFDLTPEYLLCERDAAFLRDTDDIIEIHTLAESRGRMALQERIGP